MSSMTFSDPLSFRLPEFTRTAWATKQAQDVWRSRMSEIVAAWRMVEWQSVVKGVRSCALIRASEDKLVDQAQLWFEAGLDVIPLQMEGASGATYKVKTQPARRGSPNVVRAVVGSRESAARFERAWKSEDHDAVGALLGYPCCCRAFFQQVWVQNRVVDTTWAMAVNTSPPSDQVIDVLGPAGTNLLWRWLGVRPVAHLPCSFHCEPTIALSKDFLAVGRDLGYELQLEWLGEILSWSIEWSALHGIAEIKTPILKISTMTDATGSKYVVRRGGDGFPVEGARGTRFPYQAALEQSSRKKSFLLGLANPILPILQDASPAWRYAENGFSSDYEMDRLHAPLVATVKNEFADISGSVIDLGCGNGILLSKICGLNQRLVPFGVDQNSQAIEYARRVHPAFASNFHQGNMFDDSLWCQDRHYALGIIMVGRILEGAANSKKIPAILDQLRSCCDALLVYVYPDWNKEPFADLLHRSGLPPVKITANGVGVCHYLTIH